MYNFISLIQAACAKGEYLLRSKGFRQNGSYRRFRTTYCSYPQESSVQGHLETSVTNYQSSCVKSQRRSHLHCGETFKLHMLSA